MCAHMSFLLSLCAPVTLLVVTGCETPVNTDYKAGADFSRYRTFAMMSAPKLVSPEDPGLSLRLAEPAKEAVVASLTAKGLRESTPDQADLSVNLRGQSLPQVEVRDYGFTYPAMTRYGTVTVVQNPYTSVSSYSERTLVVELLDNHDKELVWVGWMKKESQGTVKAEALQEAIRKILEKFPPPPSEPPSKKT
jgi:hypothetical protein